MQDHVRARAWGFWTVGKLDLLRDYLAAFAIASKNQSETVYLDLFAGQAKNYEKLSANPIEGSAIIALSTDPPFTRLRMFEQRPNRAIQLKAHLLELFPGRDVDVYPRDCNSGITKVLDDLRWISWAPTFALIDPENAACHWETLRLLAAHKQGRKTKVELWLLFPDGFFVRTLPLERQELLRPEQVDRLTQMFGTDGWRAIYDARRSRVLTGAEAREEYVNLIRWRLETVLGYKRTHPLRVVNQANSPLYHMIFATDSDAGDRIMTSLYSKAAQRFPKMRAEALERSRLIKQAEAGQQALFGADEMIATLGKPQPSEAYRYEPPLDPFPREAEES